MAKNKFYNFFPFYRITYNLIALILLFFLLLYQSKITLTILFHNSLGVIILGYSITFFGLILSFFAFKNYSGLEFSGLDFNKKNEATNLSLSTSGLNKYVRHPLYFATLLIIWGYFITNSALTVLIMNSIISLYLIIGTKLEERKLVNEFGEQYKQYIKDVPMLLPIK